MIGLRIALFLAMLCAGCRFDLPRETSDGPRQDAEAGTDAHMPACLTSAAYTVRPGTERRYRALSESTSYDAAIDRCAADGAHVVVIDDAAENTYVTGLLGGSGEAWLGIDDLTEEGSFQWVTGAVGSNQYSNGEPNNVNNEDCTTVRASSGGWHDVGCESAYRPICECDPMYRPPPTPACRSMTANSFERSGRRFFRGDTPVSWAAAKAACEAIGAHLLVIGDFAENQEMDQSLNGAPFWIGYTDAVAEGTFTWVTAAASSYRNWPGGTTPANDARDCAVLQDGGTWANIDCAMTNSYVCECDPLPP